MPTAAAGPRAPTAPTSDDFQKIKLRQRVAVNMENRSTATTMIGQDVAMPVAIAPTGLTGMQHADGEILAARAAEVRHAVHALDHEHLLDRGRGAARGRTTRSGSSSM
jgi:isopentenyl diphosphate isomerase/L-lactate dehydrogenase-like FMN-dependent dehydrogenase